MNRQPNSSRQIIAAAYYLAEQYPRLLETAEDASNLEPTWEEWLKVFLETRRKMAEVGIDLIEVIVDLDKLEQYCQEQGLKNTGGTRAHYAAYLLFGQQPQQQSSMSLRFKKKKHRNR